MKILSATLVDYKRVRLNNVHKIIYNPAEKMQIVLGTNGSGKSSLLSELTPLPTNRADYGSDGFKQLEISHSNKYYRLLYNYASGIYNFIVDDNELNAGGTKSGFSGLVLEHFGVTPQIQDLSLNTSGLSNMGMAERKYWFGLLSNSNHTYAIKVFKELSSTLRDVSGSIKILQSRLATESSKSIDSQELELLEHEYDELSKEHDFLLSSLKDVPISRPDAVSRLQQASNRRSTIESKLKDIDTDESVSGVEKQISELRGRIDALNQKVIEYNKTIIELKEKLQSLGNSTDTKKIEQQISTIENHIKDIVLPEYLDNVDDLFINTWKQQEELIGNTINTIGTITDDIGPNETSEDHIDKQISTLKDQLNILRKKISDKVAKDKLYTKLNDDGIVCDSCGAIVGMKHDSDSCKTELETLDTEYTHLEEQISQLEDHLGRSQMRSKAFLALKGMMVGVLDIKPLSAILNDPHFFNKIHTFIQIVNDITQNIDMASRKISLAKELLDLQSKLRDSKSVDTRLIASIEDQLSSVQSTLELTQSEINTIVLKKNNLTQKQSKLRELENIRNELSTIVETTIPTLEERLKDLDTNDQIKKRINVVRTELAKLSDKINTSKEHDKVISDIKEQLSSLMTRKSNLSVMVKNLSPTEGIIAESISGSMVEVLNTVNDIISRIWTYPLVVLPCTNKEEILEMTYKFPVRVGNEGMVVSDVSKMSTSMKEIVNLAFRITVLSMLNVTPYPLYLDEFGKSFDSAHRERAYRMIEGQLLPAGEISQIFMVSHFMENYGAMSNCDVNILSPDNIDIPNVEYNNAIKFI